MRTVYALVQEDYETSQLECLFETESLARAAADRCGNQYEVKPVAMFDDMPTVVAQHKVFRDYASDGRQVSDYHLVEYFIDCGQDDYRISDAKQRWVRYYCHADGSGNRGLQVQGPSLEACDRVHQHYASKLHGMEDLGCCFTMLEWPEGIA